MLKKLTVILSVIMTLTLAAEPIMLQKELKLDAATKGSTSTTLEIPAMSIPAGKIAVLKFNCRIAFNTYAGWGNFLQLVINNKVLEGKTAAGEDRVLFRHGEIKTSKAKTPSLPWFGKNRRNTALVVFYAPENTDKLPPQILNDREAGFNYTIRIDDLLAKGKKNQLKLNYLLQRRHVQNRNVQLVMRDLVVDFIDLPSAQTVQKPVMKNGELVISKRLTVDAPFADINKIKIDFPAVQVPRNKVPVLAFNARIATESLGGWNNYLQLRLNNKRLDRETADGEYRLLHRGATMKNTMPSENNRDWWRGSKGGRALLIFFAPESATELDKRVISNRNCRYDYEIDISDLVNRLEIGADDRIESNKSNSLQLEYSLMRRYVGNKNVPLVIKDLRIKFVDKDKVEKSRPKNDTAAIVRNAEKTAASLAGGNAVLEIAASGALQLRSKGETVFVDSFFSYPAKPAMKFNVMGKNAAPNADDWQLKISKEKQTLILVARSRAFEIRREITFSGKRFNFHDRIKNISGKNAGLAFFERFSGNTLQKRAVKLAGQADIRGTIDFFGASNPTVFLPGKAASWGVVYEDTLSRAQLQLRNRGSFYEAGSIGCGAKPGDTIEREFAIYPIEGTDYFDFINQVRRDWGMNKFTIPGTLSFANRGQQPEIPNKLSTIKPWFEFCYYGNNDQDGALLSRQEFIAKVQKQIRDLRAKRPDTRIFACIENNLVPFDCRKYDWANNIRQKKFNEPRNAPGIRYAQFLSKELTARLDAVTPLKDSIIRSADGRAMFDNMYPNAPVINLMVQPELGNSRYKQMIEQIDFLMDKAGVDSIYIDQFQPYTKGGFSENRWDGRTVELAPDGSIKRYRYSYALTGATARAAIIKHITDKGGLVLTNGQSMSREEQGLFRLAFQEMENDSVNPLLFMDECPPEFRWQSISHLGCPVALGIRPRKYLNVKKRPNRAAEVLTKGVITALRNGLLYYVYIYDINTDGKSDSGSFDMFERMYPFTPVELNAGYLIGKERIITAVSRSFTVAGKQKPRCTHYNKRGIPAAADFVISGKPGAWQVEVKLRDWNEIAIIEIQ